MFAVRSALSSFFNFLSAVPILGGLIKRISDLARAVFSSQGSPSAPPLTGRVGSLVLPPPPLPVSALSSPVLFAPVFLSRPDPDWRLPSIPSSFVMRATLAPAAASAGAGALVAPGEGVEPGLGIPRSYCEALPAERLRARQEVYANLFPHAPQECTPIPLMTSYHGEDCFIFKRGEDLCFLVRNYENKLLVLKRNGATECFQWVRPNNGDPLCVKICNEEEVHLENSRNFRLVRDERGLRGSETWEFYWDPIKQGKWSRRYAPAYFATPMASMQLLLAHQDHILSFLRGNDVYSPIISGFLEAFAPFVAAGAIDRFRTAHPAIAGRELLLSGAGSAGVVARIGLPVIAGGAAASLVSGAVSVALPDGAGSPPSTETESLILGPIWNRVSESDDSSFTLRLTRHSDGSLEVSSTKQFGGRGFGDCGTRNLSIRIMPDRSLQLTITKQSSNRMTDGYGSRVVYQLTRAGEGFSIASTQRTVTSEHLGETLRDNSPEEFSSDVAFFLNSLRTIRNLWVSPYSLVVPEGSRVAHPLRDLSREIPEGRLRQLARLSQGAGGIVGRLSYLQNRFYEFQHELPILPTLC